MSRNVDVGAVYEHYVAEYLVGQGYRKVKVTQQSGDYGVDVIAQNGKDKYAIQCKYYSSPVGVEAVQQVVGGMAHYGCTRAMVVTNNGYTRPAIKLAHENGVTLLGNLQMVAKSKPKIYSQKNRLKWWLRFGMYFFGVGMACAIIMLLTEPVTDENIGVSLFVGLGFAFFALAVYVPELIVLLKRRRYIRKVKEAAPTTHKTYPWQNQKRHGISPLSSSEEVSDTWQNPISSKADTTELEFTIK